MQHLKTVKGFVVHFILNHLVIMSQSFEFQSLSVDPHQLQKTQSSVAPIVAVDYVLIESSPPWQDAQFLCRSYSGSSFVSIHSRSEYNMIQDLLDWIK